MRNFSIRRIAAAAVIGAVYAVLTLAFRPIAFGPLQCRVSEALCVLPFLFPGSAWGLFVGCALANLLGSASALDMVFGPLATLLAAWLTSRAPSRWLAPLPPVIVNALVVGAVLAYTDTQGGAAFLPIFLVYAAQIGAGEMAACYALGLPLLSVIERIPVLGRYLGEGR
ncbi:MAG TPA: QueT transporter family protein [Oscillospiraceae bacterium]|nr:QueT transporter family protein [Oscillospiraceae bacterium]